jgi:hypothetical protein
MKQQTNLTFIFVVLTFFTMVSGCQVAAPEVGQVTATVMLDEPTKIAQPSITPETANTIKPTRTPKPSATKTPTNTPEPTAPANPTATWIVPSGGAESDIEDIELAKATLIRCLDHLYYDEFTEAAALIDKEALKSYIELWDGDNPGELFLLMDLSPELDLAEKEDLIEFLDPACRWFFCLRVKTVHSKEQISATEYRFIVGLFDHGLENEFSIDDCCGASPHTEFEFTVKKDVDRTFRVINPIIFVFLP